MMSRQKSRASKAGTCQSLISQHKGGDIAFRVEAKTFIGVMDRAILIMEFILGCWDSKWPFTIWQTFLGVLGTCRMTVAAQKGGLQNKGQEDWLQQNSLFQIQYGSCTYEPTAVVTACAIRRQNQANTILAWSGEVVPKSPPLAEELRQPMAAGGVRAIFPQWCGHRETSDPWDDMQVPDAIAGSSGLERRTHEIGRNWDAGEGTGEEGMSGGLHQNKFACMRFSIKVGKNY